MEWLTEINAYHWLALGLILFAAEALGAAGFLLGTAAAALVVGLLAGGEGWHNNHHFVQRAANHGQRWWEVDASFAVILLLALLSYPLKWVGLGRYRLAYDILVYSWRTQQFSKWFV